MLLNGIVYNKNTNTVEIIDSSIIYCFPTIVCTVQMQAYGNSVQ